MKSVGGQTFDVHDALERPILGHNPVLAPPKRVSNVKPKIGGIDLLMRRKPSDFS